MTVWIHVADKKTGRCVYEMPIEVPDDFTASDLDHLGKLATAKFNSAMSRMIDEQIMTGENR
jgi:hypothetical protein